MFQVLFVRPLGNEIIPVCTVGTESAEESDLLSNLRYHPLKTQPQNWKNKLAVSAYHLTYMSLQINLLYFHYSLCGSFLGETLFGNLDLQNTASKSCLP